MKKAIYTALYLIFGAAILYTAHNLFNAKMDVVELSVAVGAMIAGAIAVSLIYLAFMWKR